MLYDCTVPYMRTDLSHRFAPTPPPTHTYTFRLQKKGEKKTRKLRHVAHKSKLKRYVQLSSQLLLVKGNNVKQDTRTHRTNHSTD